LVQGALYPAVTDKQVFAQFIPWVPIEKQRQIAARLKAQLAEVDTARQAAEAQLRDATSLKTKALEAIFGGVSDKQPIGSAAKLQSGYAFKSESFRTNGIRLLRNANILPGKVYWDEAVFLNEADASKYPSYVLNDGDVLISLDRPIISCGIKAARVGADDLPALLVQRVGRFILDPEKLDADYLYAYLQTEMFITEITGHDQSLGVPHISPTQVENIEIPLPSMTVQRELSNRLSQAQYEWETATTTIRAMLNDINLLPRKILAQAFEM
jgi:type I restriction enzyme S subunit